MYIYIYIYKYISKQSCIVQFWTAMHFLMNMLDSEPMKYARVGESIEKVFDDRTNDIKEE